MATVISVEDAFDTMRQGRSGTGAVRLNTVRKKNENEHHISGISCIFRGGVTLFYSIPPKYRWKWLIVLSIAFVYAASAIGLFFVVLTSVIVYLAARKIEKTDESENGKKKILIGAMGSCLLILVFLKYLSGLPVFAQKSLIVLGNEMTAQSAIRKYLLPIGMSYYTLQVISYLLDVYWGRIEAEQNYWKVLLFTCYFPQLVQGPISKYGELAPELFKEHRLNWKNIKYGVQLMLWGFYKKMVIADYVGGFVHAAFYRGIDAYGWAAWLGLALYGIQLYCDFSGGIDVIRGASECFGIGLKENFRQPYFSLSLGEFWRRWHISLGTWMKDYVFYPVSMSGWMGALKKKLKKVTSRKTATRISMAIADIIVFGLVGIWHGLGTNYLAWGLYNGIILAVSAVLVDAYAEWKKKLHIDSQAKYWKAFCLMRTLLIVTIGWIFDCTDTAGAAGGLLVRLFAFGKTDLSVMLMSVTDIAAISMSCLMLLVVDLLHESNKEVRQMLETKNYWVQVVFWTIVIQAIALFGRVPTAGGFMYANF